MPEDLLHYDAMIENALRDVVHQTMNKVVKDGLPGDHHFYISFTTRYEGVALPPYLKEKYPEEMTIVLQHQFYGLTVDEHSFSVMLSFNNVREKLVIPFAAITTFVDPSVNFALQFQAPTSGPEDGPDGTPPDGDGPGPDKSTPDQSGDVIRLDQFRKK